MNRSIFELDMFNYANDVASPPVNFQFTREQKIEMDQFFHEKKYANSANFHLDLYQAAIVALCKSILPTITSSPIDLVSVPINASGALRRLIEALFITHTQAQLNTDGHLDKLLFPDATINLDDPSEQVPWCKNLVRRSNATNTNFV
jgi:hypothetical protein